jgi:YopX protein
MIQREIKFRAWDGKKKDWISKFRIYSDGGKVVGVNHAYGNIHLMQFTGLKDKNGKEIYEGDLVKLDEYRHGPEVREIFWSNKSDCGFTWHDGLGLIFCEGNVEHFEVIGNIYENPELLSNEKVEIKPKHQ